MYDATLSNACVLLLLFFQVQSIIAPIPPLDLLDDLDWGLLDDIELPDLDLPDNDSFLADLADPIPADGDFCFNPPPTNPIIRLPKPPEPPEEPSYADIEALIECPAPLPDYGWPNPMTSGIRPANYKNRQSPPYTRASSALTLLCSFSGIFQHQRSANAGCACVSPVANKIHCFPQLAHPSLVASASIIDYCYSKCRCRKPAPGEVGFGKERKFKTVWQTAKAMDMLKNSKEGAKTCSEPSNSGPNTPTQEKEGRRKGQWSGGSGSGSGGTCAASGCRKSDFRCGAADSNCGCTLKSIGQGLWAPKGCKTLSWLRQAAGTAISAGSLGGRRRKRSKIGILRRDETVEQHVCPCNGTFVATECCGVETGLVWGVPSLGAIAEL